jgi:VanZ family protein
MKWLTLLFALFVILIIILADTGNLGVVYCITRLPYADKAGHFLLYGILALLIDLSLFRALPVQNRQRVAVTSGLVLALLIGLEEFSQQYFADRTFSLMDLGASYLGVLSFSWLAVKVRARYIVPLPR